MKKSYSIIASLFSAIVKFVKETFSMEITGKCAQFQAIPGCGLRCVVSHTETMMDQISHSETFINFNNLVRLVVDVFCCVLLVRGYSDTNFI